MSPALVGALAQRFGERCVVADPERCARYAGDWSGLSPQTPELVVRPETTEQAAELVAHLYQLGVPVTFRGAGTGKAGGCIPSLGSVVLSTERMNGAPIVRADDLVVSCSAGTLAARLDEEAAAHGLFYPPDPNSLAISSIGGNVATNAGGPKAVKYGLTGHYLLGLTYVGAQGEVVRTGADTIKSVAGTNLSGLLLGSEGTFGLITEVTMRLVARPQTVQTALLTFESTAAAVQAVGALFRSGVMPRCAELLDEISCDTIRNLEQHALPQGCQAALILETDGTEDQSLDELLTLTEAAQPLETMVAQTPSQRERIWAPRRDLSVALRDRRALKVSEDIAVPRGQLATAVERIREAASATPLRSQPTDTQVTVTSMSTSSSIVKPSAPRSRRSKTTSFGSPSICVERSPVSTASAWRNVTRCHGKPARRAWRLSIGSKRSWTPSCSSTLVKCWDHERSSPHHRLDPEGQRSLAGAARRRPTQSRRRDPAGARPRDETSQSLPADRPTAQ